MLPRFCLLFAIVAAALSTFFSAIVLISADNDEDVLKNLNWSYGEVNSNDYIYVGVYEFGYDYSSNWQTVKYDSSSCSASPCDKCKSDMGAVIAFAVFFFIISFVPLYTSILRYREGGNTSLHRTIGVLAAVACIVCAFISLVTFSGGCEKSVEDYYDNGVSWNYGPAFGLLATCLMFEVVVIIFNCLVGMDV